MLACPKCNYDNELGRIFCHQCGTKLDLESIEPPSRGGKSLKKKTKFDVGKAIGWTIRLVIIGGLVLVVALIAQVPPLKEIATTPKDLESFSRKRNNLEIAEMTRKPASISLSAAELNAFLSSMPFDQPAGSGVKVQPTKLQIDLEENQAAASILGKIKVGSSWEKQMCITYTTVPVLVDGRLVFQPVVAHVGKLPIPKWVLEHTTFIQGYFDQLFRNLSAESQLLNQLTSFSLDDGNALLEYKPEAKPKP